MKIEIPKPYTTKRVSFTTGGHQHQIQSGDCRFGCRDGTEAKTWSDRLNDAYAAGWNAATRKNHAMKESL